MKRRAFLLAILGILGAGCARATPEKPRPAAATPHVEAAKTMEAADLLKELRRMRDRATPDDLKVLLSRCSAGTRPDDALIRHEALDALATVASRIRLDASDLSAEGAAAAMATLSSAPFVDQALLMLLDVDPEMRRGACRLLGALALPRTRTPLEERVADDADPQVRVLARRALDAL